MPRAVVVPRIGERCVQIWQEWRAAGVPAAIELDAVVVIGRIAVVDSWQLICRASRFETLFRVQKS